MITIIHFGGQYAHLIQRRLNELGVATQILEWTQVPAGKPASTQGVILSGGPASVTEAVSKQLQRVLNWQVPVLGICFGHQALVHHTGGVVVQQTEHEYGRADLFLTAESPLTVGIPHASTVWLSHGDSVTKLPTGWRAIAATPAGPYAAIQSERRPLYGVQFHPEVNHTKYGRELLQNFVFGICRAEQTFSSPSLVQTAMNAIREGVGDGHVFVACSLGVDSTTAAVLATQTLGADRVHPVFVDNGLQRTEDLDLIGEVNELLPNLKVVDAQDKFLNALVGIRDPEAKRRLIGEKFWEVFSQTIADLQRHVPITAYIQGTIAPDVIESGAESRHAATIKTHHNLVQPHAAFPFRPIEPFRTLYKDQVRAIARELKVPELIITKHPFPGPGLAVRVKGPITPERVAVVRQCDAIFIRALRESGRYETIAQAGATLLEDTVTCVRGDSGGQGWIVILWAVTTKDFMTADIAPLPLDFLVEVSDQITNQVKKIGCAVYRTTRKPPATIELE